MKNLVKAVTCGVLAICASAGFAGDEKGNGGDAVVCRDASNAITDIELLDFFEADQLRGISSDLEEFEGDEWTIASQVLERLARLDAIRSEDFSVWLGEFSSEVRWLRGVTLVDVPDSGHLFFPEGCKVEQLAIHREPAVSQDKRYIINQDLWDRLSSGQKAGLIVHELVYRQFKARFQHEDSILTRYFVSVISSDLIETMSADAYMTFLEDSGAASEVRIGGALFRMGTVSFYPSGNIKSGHLAGRAKFPVFNNELCEFGVDAPGVAYERDLLSFIEFQENGLPAKGEIYIGQTLMTQGRGYRRWDERGRFCSFDESGRVIERLPFCYGAYPGTYAANSQ